MKKLLFLLALCISIVGYSFAIDKPEEANSIGDTITVKQYGKELYSYSIDKITVKETKPQQVLIIDYTYTNIDYPKGMLFLDASSFEFVSGSAEEGYVYQDSSITKYPYEIPKGSTVKAQMCIAFEKASDNILIVHKDKENSIVTSSIK